MDLNVLPLDALFAELTRDGCLTRLVRSAFEEDLGPGGVSGDVTARVVFDRPHTARAAIVARSHGVLAGAACIPGILAQFAPDVELDLRLADGAALTPEHSGIGTLEGPIDQIVRAERTLLNLLGRLSGVATRTAEFVALIADLPEFTRPRLLDTRKTTPGLRNLEKYAVRCGGGFCHRIGLHDAVLIKDNHIAGVPDDELADFLHHAIARAHALAKEVGGLRFIEVEVDRLEQLEVILRAGGCGLDIVLLDNMPVDALRMAVQLRNASSLPVLLEASGGVHKDSIRAIASTGVDRISVGGLTHQAVSLDIGLDINV